MLAIAAASAFSAAAFSAAAFSAAAFFAAASAAAFSSAAFSSSDLRTAEVEIPLEFTKPVDTGESLSASWCIRSADMAEHEAGCRDAGTTRLLGAKLPKARHPEVRSSARLMLELVELNLPPLLSGWRGS